MVQIFGLEFLSFPGPPDNLGAQGVLSRITGTNVEVAGYSVTDMTNLTVALRKLRMQKTDAPLFILISGHGADGKIALGHKSILISKIFELNPGLFNNSWVHLSYCGSLTLPLDIRLQLIEQYNLSQVSGYKRHPLWDEAYRLDLTEITNFIDSNI